MELTRNALDKKDLKILYELERDARQSYNEIAKKTGMSKEVVLYRVKNLENSGLIKGYITEMDLYKLGFRMYPILFKFEELPEKIEKEMTSFIKKSENIGWAAWCDGSWDLNIAPRVKNATEVSVFLEEFDMRFGDYILEKQLMHTLQFNYFKRNFGFGESRRSIIKSGETTETLEVSSEEAKFLRSISLDARKQISLLAKDAGVSVPTTIEMMRRLKKNQILQGFRIFTNFANLGHSYYKIWFNLRNMNKENWKKLYSFLSFEPHVLWATQTIGYYDFSVELEIPSVREFQFFAKRLKANFSDIIKRKDVLLVSDEILASYFPSTIV
ncbi:MAG: winged helix-turn-helix transcriptional regulator [Candidatus Micrarchaeota archaeon]